MSDQSVSAETSDSMEEVVATELEETSWGRAVRKAGREDEAEAEAEEVMAVDICDACRESGKKDG